MSFNLKEALQELNVRNGSDLHIGTGTVPMIRVVGDLTNLNYEPLTEQEMLGILHDLVSPVKYDAYTTHGEIDFRWEIPGLAIYRVNFYKTIRGTAAVFRQIPSRVPSLKKLGVPAHLAKLPMLDSGIVLVTGPTGSGKSTVTAAMVDYANQMRSDHILTIEDPIEFTYTNKKCLVSQREVGTHSDSFASALRVALREDPDIIVVGEMRDRETVALAIEAAETGHLVFATLHTRSAAQSVDRIIDIFPAAEQAQIRTSLADSLQAIMSVALLKTADGARRVQAMEILMATPAIRNMIREAKTHLIHNALQTGRAQGMCTMDDSLKELVSEGLVTPQTARKYARNAANFEVSDF